MRKRKRVLALVAALFVSHAACAQNEDDNLAALQSTDPDARIAAVRELQTSLDARIPDAMLALLNDEGNSIRRLAARAIGSRWWQIPRDRLPEFVAALKRNARSEFEDERNMVARAIGLLTRDYAGEMFARSANRRWVIYERHAQACLIDTSNETEELLQHEPSFAPAWGNSTLKGAVMWHATREIAAINLILNRKESTIAVWQHRARRRVFDTSEFIRAAGLRENTVHSSGGIYADAKEWKSDALRVEAGFDTGPYDSLVQHQIVLGWNCTTDKLRIISHKTTRE